LISPINGKLVGNESIDFRWEGFDPQNDSLQFKLEVRNAISGDLYVERYIYDKNVTLWLPPWRYTWTVIPFDGQLWGWNINGTWMFEVTGKVNRPPAVGSSPPRTAYVAHEYQYQVQATDPDKDTLAFSLMDAPNNMTVDRKSGLVVWTPGPDDIGTRDLTVVVLDGKGGKTTQSFRIYISQETGPVRTSAQDRTQYFAVLIVIIIILCASAVALAVAHGRKRQR
jgi:hypothetical protein